MLCTFLMTIAVAGVTALITKSGVKLNHFYRTSKKNVSFFYFFATFLLDWDLEYYENLAF